MDALKSHFTEHASVLAPLGAVALTYVTYKLLRNIVSGFYVYFLSRMLGLTRNLTKLGEWAVVTGSTDGIGKGYAHELARKGINIVLISRSPEKLQDVAKEIESKFKVKTKIVAIDFAGGSEIYDKVKKELAGLDVGILVNNVGMSFEHPEYYAEVKDEVVQKMLTVNMQSVAMMTKIVLPSMVEKKKGAVINIASGAALFPVALLAPYSASKAFVDYLSEALQQEYASRGIIVQCVLPFFVATKLSRIRRSSFFIPDPYSYARSALATVGLQSRTFGCLSHAIQASVQGLIPSWVIEKISMSQMMAVRKAAHRRAQKKQ